VIYRLLFRLVLTRLDPEAGWRSEETLDDSDRIERNRYDRDDGYAYGRGGERFRVVEERRVGADGCTLAESPIHMPDGRTQMRFVRVCMDSTGRYQVVD